MVPVGHGQSLLHRIADKERKGCKPAVSHVRNTPSETLVYVHRPQARLAKTTSFAVPKHTLPVSSHFALKLQHTIKQRFSSWRAPRDVNIHGHNPITTADNSV